MKSFSLQKAWGSGARIGVLELVNCPGVSIETPALLISTRKGLPYFTPPDLLPSLPSPDSHLLQVSPLHFLEGLSPATIRKIGGIHKLIGLGEYGVAAVPRDNVHSLPECKGASKLGASFETPCGRLLIKPKDYVEMISCMRPNMWATLADEVPAWVSDKRNRTSVDRTLKWLDDCLALNPAVGSVFGAIVGGSNLDERKRCAEEVAKRNVAGYWIGGFGLGDAIDERPALLRAIVDVLPVEKPRMICGLGLPEELLQGIAAGIDLFDSTYIYTLTLGGFALTFSLDKNGNQDNFRQSKMGSDSTKINLRATAYRKDMSPIVGGCTCHTCQNYTKAYINHLYNVHEMLAQTLLEIQLTVDSCLQPLCAPTHVSRFLFELLSSLSVVMESSAALRLTNIRRHLDCSGTVDKPIGANAIGASIIVKVALEVSEALSLGRAVVALESTIISHGMPYPQNLQTAKEVEGIVRENGAVPATIAILDGVPIIGLSGEELERLATLGPRAQKTARRDIAYVVARGGNGATTVSATMFLASKVGIHIFVTGGIGGVHRHGEYTMDISSDITELGRTPVAVICAGVKSILDIPRTLEYLETQGVCVAAYKTNEFPAFFTASSGCKVPCRVDTPEECASLIEANIKLKVGSGILIGVPIPQDQSASGHIIESAINKALEEAREKNISGNAQTPFLLDRVNALTGGASLASNIALVKNNALIGAKAAVALALLIENSQRKQEIV